MDLSRIPLFAALKTKMAWLNERQSVLAQNIANSDTPDFRPTDLKPLNFKGLMEGGNRGPGLAADDPRHFTLGPGERSAFKHDRASPFEVSTSGNGVSLETEMMKVSETQASYETALNLYRKQIGLLHTALDKG